MAVASSYDSEDTDEADDEVDDDDEEDDTEADDDVEDDEEDEDDDVRAMLNGRWSLLNPLDACLSLFQQRCFLCAQ